MNKAFITAAAMALTGVGYHLDPKFADEYLEALVVAVVAALTLELLAKLFRRKSRKRKR